MTHKYNPGLGGVGRNISTAVVAIAIDWAVVVVNETEVAQPVGITRIYTMVASSDAFASRAFRFNNATRLADEFFVRSLGSVEIESTAELDPRAPLKVLVEIFRMPPRSQSFCAMDLR